MTIQINIKGNTIDITPDILYLFEDPRMVEGINTYKLKYTVVGAAMVHYDNPLNINYKRIHNVYVDSIGYFIDVLDNKVYLDDIDSYPIKNPNSLYNRYSIYNEIKFNTNLK